MAVVRMLEAWTAFCLCGSVKSVDLTPMMRIGELSPPTLASFGGHLVEGILALCENEQTNGLSFLHSVQFLIDDFLCMNL
jgi:hypothetical protein